MNYTLPLFSLIRRKRFAQRKAGGYTFNCSKVTVRQTFTEIPMSIVDTLSPNNMRQRWLCIWNRCSAAFGATLQLTCQVFVAVDFLKLLQPKNRTVMVPPSLCVFVFQIHVGYYSQVNENQNFLSYFHWVRIPKLRNMVWTMSSFFVLSFPRCMYCWGIFK